MLWIEFVGYILRIISSTYTLSRIFPKNAKPLIFFNIAKACITVHGIIHEYSTSPQVERWFNFSFLTSNRSFKSILASARSFAWFRFLRGITSRRKSEWVGIVDSLTTTTGVLGIRRYKHKTVLEESSEGHICPKNFPPSPSMGRKLLVPLRGVV